MNSPVSGMRGFAMGLMALALAACGGQQPSSGVPETPPADTSETVERSRADQVAAERRERERQRLAEAAQDSAFVYLRYAPDLSSSQPRACLVFSRPLDPETDYAVYVETGSAQPAFSVEGQSLCLSGLEFSRSYTAVLLEGLPAADGSLLGREEEVSLSFEDRPAYVGFRGSGVILPRDDADGLAVETVNVEKVRVTVSRVNDRALVFKSITNGREAAEGRYAYLYGDESPEDVDEEIWSGTMEIDSLRNAPVLTIFPLPDVIGTLEPGAYFVEVIDAKPVTRQNGPAASARRWIMLTDLALTAYRSESGLDVALRSLQDGRIMPNTPIQLIAANNDVLGEATTGVDGRVRFNAELLAGTGSVAPRLILARGLKGDTAVLDLRRAPVDLSEFPVGGRSTPGQVDAYLYTERGIYRPGETVHLTAMLRDRTGRAVTGRTGTLITYRPNGVEAFRERIQPAQAGTFQRDLALPKTAARGMWRSVIELDGLGVVGRISYSVEDFVPQRIAVELDTDESPIVSADETRLVEVTSRFLYGAPGAGLTVKASARIERDPSPFDGYEGFRWGPAEADFRERYLEFDDRTTDGTGVALVRLDPEGLAATSPYPLRLNAVIDVLEPGGRAVSDSVRVPYRPAGPYLGIKPDFERRVPEGERAVFDLAAVNALGEGLNEEIRWSILAIDYHYDWFREDGRWRWRRSRTVRSVNEGVTTTEQGAAQIDIGGLEWGRHELRLQTESGAEASLAFSVGWGGEAEDGVEAPDRVEVLVDEQTVIPGRPAAVTIVPPYDGDAQIVVATDKVLTVETRPVSASGTEITLPVTSDWGEGAYVMVNVYSPRDPILQAKPRRAVGVGYVPVDMSQRTFSVEIDAPDLARPDRTQKVSVKLDGGPREKAFVTLAAVDEGILRLTDFQSPDPTDWYFGKKALGVSLHDDYGRLLNPNLGLPAEVRTGGDQLGGEGLSVVPVKTVALFSGVVEVGRNATAEIEFDLPPFNGELRLMAVAWSETGLGAASTPMTVRDRAPADLILPRFVAPGDSAVATVSVDNVELDAGEFTMTLDATAPLDVSAQSLTARLAEGQRVDQGIRFSAEESGISRVRLSVDGPDGYSVERTLPIEVRSPYLPVTRFSRTLMEAGQTFVADESLLDGLVPGTEQITVSFSGLPVDAAALYASLARYPYGCTEQATSRALPLLYSEQLLPEGADDGGQRDQVQLAVSTLLNRQSSDGAFGLWREGDRSASPWLGAYTTDFLVRANEAGYEVPEAALQRAYSALEGVAEGDAWRVYGYDTDVYESRWHDDTEQKMMLRASSYALYVLARAGRADISRLRYLHDRELGRIESPLARAHLAAGLAYLGDRARATSAFEAAEKALDYQNSGDYYQTPLRDLAGVIALAAESDFPDIVARLSERLLNEVEEPDALTTQEKAFLLVAVDSLNQGEAFSLDVDGLGAGNGDARTFTLAAADVRNTPSFRLRRASPPAFRTVMVTGSPETAPAATSQSLQVQKAVRQLDGGRVDLGQVRQGDQFVVSILVTPQQRRNNPIIVADLLPAGFEIETILQPADGAREDGPDGAFAWLGEINRAKTAEARDDRFIAAVDVVRDPVRVAYLVRAVTPGSFAMAGAVAEDMYRPEVFARSTAGRVEITASAVGPGGAQ